MNDAYNQLLERVRNIGRLTNISALLDWDQEVCMPEKGLTARGELLSLVAGLAHEHLVCDETRRLLDDAGVRDDAFPEGTIVRETRRQYERNAKLPKALVQEIATASTHAKDAWAKARADADFARFAPHLQKMIDLKKQVAERIGFEGEPYNTLMDEFEPGMTVEKVEPLFKQLEEAIAPLVKEIAGAKDRPDESILARHYPQQTQARFARAFAEAIGFDFDAGRDDVSVHPFCTTVGSTFDVRITTRYQEDFLPAALFGALHEAGHGLYEQGFDEQWRFTPASEAVSLGIHESQSRMWENMVGRSRAFWDANYPAVRQAFDALEDVELEDFYRAVNTVEPSMIRVEADELTYNLHIVLRFQLERALFSGKLEVKDVPEAWNESMKRLLGIVPRNDAEGCLQDIHWSIGIFGYFPTYCLGNLYAAQFYRKAAADIPDLDERIRRNDHSALLEWLRNNIHRHGRRYLAPELVQRITGKPLAIDDFVDYATRKFSAVYRLDR